MPLEAPTALVSRRPPSAPGFVPRPRLVRRLLEAEAPIALIVAPAGYGKSTLLAEWATRDERPFRSVPLTAMDAGGALSALAEATAGARATVIVVEDAHRAAPAAVRALLEGACLLPAACTLAIVSRAWPGAPVGRLRAQRKVVEVGMEELALSRLEAAMLLDAAGVRLDGEQLDRLLMTTEGWAAALTLAAGALRGADDVDAAIAAFGHGDRAVADFLRDELLDACTDDERVFLRRASILATLTPGACDAVSQAAGTGVRVAALARRGLPLAPLDGRELEFRPHPLLVQALRAELARVEPELASVLHRRAARWHARRREPVRALEHAVAGRDAALAGRILWPLAAAGEPLGGHLAFDERALYADPRLALTVAVHKLTTGHGGAAARATDAAVRALGTDDHAAIALLRACTARESLAAMAAEAERAHLLLPPESPWHALALVLQAVAAQLSDGSAPARECLEDAARMAAGRLPAVAALAHAQLALLAADADDWDEAADEAGRARASLPGEAPEAVCALVWAACALVAAQHGEIAQARHDALDAERILAAQPDFAPWALAEAQVCLARVRILLSDGPGARRLLARAARAQARVPDGHVLADWIHAGWARADAFAETATGDGPALTNAELRVLRLLPSHMSFREIGERLYLSTNTVKTQALAVYRKLDVCCRSDAVARGRNAGLIGDA